MQTKKPKPVRLTTPVCLVRWASIDRPSTKFNKDGQFNIEVLLTAEEAEQIQKQLDPIMDEARKRALAEAKTPAAQKMVRQWAAGSPLFEELDKETGEPTGMWVLRAKRDAVLRYNEQERHITIPVYDASSPPKVIVPCPRIGRGSRVRVSIDVAPYASAGLKRLGVSARLVGVQVIELVEFVGQSPEALGFSGHEGGYVVDNEDAPLDVDADSGKPNPNF